MKNSIEVRGRKFIYDKKADAYLFDRNEERNISDLAGSASLAMHKAIICLCALNSLEEAEKTMGIDYRLSKAVQVYYVIYHVFTCCMLLDEQYPIFFFPKDESIRYGTDLRKLRRIPREAWQWNARKYDEMDLATRITHGDIKTYCSGKTKQNKGQRERTIISPGLCHSCLDGTIENRPEYIRFLSDCFVRDNCKIIPFEKADYIRDRETIPNLV